jgi:RimJ/RimL family protein N-acetyltransferase
MSIAVIYRWRIKPGMEAQFVRAWAEGTRAIHQRCPSFGARLHKADGEDPEGSLWISYARWPSEEARKACFQAHDFRDLGFAEMRAAVAETLPEIVAQIVDDQMAEPHGESLGAPGIIDAGGGFRLRALDPDRDAPALHEAFGDPEAVRYLPFPATSDVEATRVRLVRACAPATPQWAIVEGDGPALGRVTLMARRPGVAEIGVQVVPSARSRGVGRRGVSALTAFALAELKLLRLYADIDPENAASVKVFKRSGYRLEGRMKHAWVTHRGVSDSLIFAATQEWRPPE